MKQSSALIIIAAGLILSACGAMTQVASTDNGQRFRDGIYSNTPAFRTRSEKAESESDTQALIEKTKESPIYLFGDKKDTVMIPHDMSATIRYDQKLGGTVVTVGENPYDWRSDLENNYGYYYGPYSPADAWYWSRFYSPWNSWGYGPWGYHRWYEPYHYAGWYSSYCHGGWYDPWFYGGWYDPWYYAGWYDPWYHRHHWHHHGWYDPYWNHPPHHGPGYDNPGDRKDVYYGSRHETGSNKVFDRRTSLRGGAGRTTNISRNNTSSGASLKRTDRVTTSRSSAVRATPAARGELGVATRVNNGKQTATRPSGSISGRAGSATRRPAATISGTPSASRPVTASSRTGIQSNHRRPAATIIGNTSRGEYQPGRSAGTGRATSATRTSSSYERNSSSYSRSSSSSYNSSSSSSRSSFSSGSSGSSSSRSSSGGGGGYSRSGGSARR